MKSKLKNIVLITFVIITNACSHKVNKTQTSIQEENKPGFTKATVIKLSLDGCSWMLQLEDGKKLEPVNLSDEFKKENLKVWISYGPVKQAYSICMAGEIVSITSVEIRK